MIEIVLPEEPLRRAMVRYGLNIVWLSIMISLMTAALVYFAISALLVRPMMRISRNMLHFSEDPEDATPHHRPRRDAWTRSAPPSASLPRCSAS